jgi:hypothetical protein
MRRICLITPGHIASTPRLVKAADALHDAGYEVHVIASNHYPPVRALDESIIAAARWRCHRVPAPTFFRRQTGRLKRKVGRQLLAAGLRSARLAIWAMDPENGHFVNRAASLRADLYIGHTLGGLAAAARAAGQTGGLLGFDAEDWHREEIAADCLAPGEKIARSLLEEKFIPQCRQLTAASPLIARAYASLWGKSPPVVLNVFPLSEAPTQLTSPEKRSLSLYWFSQTIGPGRGLEEIVAALALLPRPWTLQLRGHAAPGYAAELNALLGNDSAGRIVWLEPALPAEMARLSATHRIGLGVELTIPPNRDICLTNKIFTYLLGGTPVLLSNTSAHRLLAPELGAAATVVDLSSPAEILAGIQRLDAAGAAAHAWQLAQTRYNWDFEQHQLLASVRAAFAGSTP